jgi:hypothetical protein
MMSERGTQIEIEDVLSSIRRLVSQDAPVPARPSGSRAPQMDAVPPQPRLDPRVRAPEAETPPAVTEDAEQVAEASCLLLTPALRIEDPEEDAASLADAEPEEAPRAEDALDAAWGQSGEEAVQTVTGHDDGPEAETADLGAELARLESTIAEMEAAVADSGIEFEPEEGDPFEVEGGAPLQSLPEDYAQNAPSDADGNLAEGSADVDDLSKSDATEAQEPAPEAPQSDVDVSASDEAEDEAWDAGEALDWSDAEAPSEGPRRLHLHDAQEVHEAPDTLRSSYDTLREELARGDALEEEAMAELDRDPDFSGAEAGLVDEEALRALVAELIRKELQGTLGERITRNVRKLVRREIQRALMSRDYE